MYPPVSPMFSFEPINLGWTKGKADYTVNYSFYVPSGDFDPNLPLNPAWAFGNIRFRRE